MSRPHLAKMLLLFLVASYGITSFILVVMSLVTGIQVKTHIFSQQCHVGGAHCGFASWAVYPVLAAAAAVCTITAIAMAVNMHFRAKQTAVDPLYVFRGVLFTLLVLVPVVVLGWLEPSHAVYTGEEYMRSLNETYPWEGIDSKSLGETYPLTHGQPTPWPPNLTRFSAVLAALRRFYGVGEGDKSVFDALERVMNSHYGEFVGMTGAFVLQQISNIPGASTVALAHFDVIFGAIIAGVAAAMAPPAGIPVGMQGALPGDGAVA